MHYLKFLWCLVLLSFSSTFVLGELNFSQKYHFNIQLSGDDYILYWSANMKSKMIEFAVNVSTTGWVGFGLSPNGQMPASDVVIGWVDGTGKVIFHDRYASVRGLPTIDKSQDWFVTSGIEENGRTLLEFHRNFTTCDINNDIDIKADTARVVWSYNSEDPLSLTQLADLIHDRKGHSSLNLLGGPSEERKENASGSLKIINENVTIPDVDTTYWCTVHKVPEAIEQQEKYIYKVSPVIYGPTAKYVHHMLTYLCTNLNDSHVGTSQRCTGTGNVDLAPCMQSSVGLGGWAVGGTSFVYPNGVSLPFGGRNRTQYIILEIHYDNPDLDVGMVDNSGLEYFYVDEEPVFRAGIMTLGHVANTKMMIPPQANRYVVNGICPGQCTRAFFPKEGITVFGNFLHTHLAGNGLTVRHYRQTANCSGGLEELPPIDENLNYDFNYQQNTHLPRTVTVLPDDILHLQCIYRTTNSAYQRMVLGGESTREEMCFSFLAYYPQTDLEFCVGEQLVSNDFITKHLNANAYTALQDSLSTRNDEEVKNIMDGVTWNSETIEEFQTSVHSNDFSLLCYNSSNPYKSIYTNTKEPNVECPYVPPTNCPVVAVDGASCDHFVVSLLFVSLFTLLYVF